MSKNRRSFHAANALLVALLAIGSVSSGADQSRFDAEPFNDEKTPAPTVKEWGKAKPISLNSSLPRGCNAYRIREWIKVRCDGLITLQLALLGGSAEGVSLYIFPAEKDEVWTRGGEIIFPVRRGDRRMFEWSTSGDSYGSHASDPSGGFLISESFAQSAKTPTIVADGNSRFVDEF